MWHVPGPGDIKSYWVVYNIPATVTKLAKNDKSTGFVGLNDKNRREYDPMKSKGPGIKKYHITVYALSEALKLPSDKATRANLLAADSPKAAGAVVNVAGGRRVSLLDLLGAIAEICGVEVAPRHEPGRAGDVRDSLADLGRARDLLGFEPSVSLREGLARTVESLRKTPEGRAAK